MRRINQGEGSQERVTNEIFLLVSSFRALNLMMDQKQLLKLGFNLSSSYFARSNHEKKTGGRNRGKEKDAG